MALISPALRQDQSQFRCDVFRQETIKQQRLQCFQEPTLIGRLSWEQEVASGLLTATVTRFLYHLTHTH